MSQTRRINFVFGAQGQQVIAVLNRIRSGIISVGDASNRSNRHAGMFNRTLYSLGTTMRYAFTGTVVYGLANTVTLLKDYNAALANISTTAQQFGTNNPLSLDSIRGIGEDLMKISTETATPVDELADSVRNIYSSMADVKPQEATEFARLFSQGAKIAETDAYNFGNAIIGMSNAFEDSDLVKIAAEFGIVTQKSLGMTGDEWARQSGRIVAAAKLSNLSLEEMNAMMIIMSREGGTAATNVRHLAQLLSKFRNPTDESMPFWAAMGLTPVQQARGKMSGVDIIERIRDYMKNRFGPNAISGLTVQKGFDEEAIANAETPAEAGLGGDAAPFLAQLFQGQLTGRMESARALGIVLRQWEGRIPAGGGPKTETFDQLVKLESDREKIVANMNTRIKENLDLRHMERAGQAIKNYRITFVQQFEGIIKKIEEGIFKFTEWENAPKAGIGVGAGILALLLARKVPFARLFKMFGAGGLAASQLGGEAPTGSFANPMWVMVHPLSPGGALGGGGGLGGKGAGAAGAASRLGRLLKNPAFRRIAGLTGIAGALAWELAFPSDAGFAGEGAAEQQRQMPELQKMLRARTFQQNLKGKLWQVPWQAREAYLNSLSPGQEQMARAMMARNRARNSAREWSQQMAPWYQGAFGQRGTPSKAYPPGAPVPGGSIRIRLEPTAEAKRLVKPAEVHVPYDHWSGGAFPSSGGGRKNNRTTRGGSHP